MTEIIGYQTFHFVLKGSSFDTKMDHFEISKVTKQRFEVMAAFDWRANQKQVPCECTPRKHTSLKIGWKLQLNSLKIRLPFLKSACLQCVNLMFEFMFFLSVLLAANLELESIGKGLVHIYSPEVRRYLAMDGNGRLFSTVS